MERLLRRVYSSKKIKTALKIISHATVGIYVASFVAMLVYFYLREPMWAVKLAIASFLPYVLVSISRRMINAPRPYELYDFYTVLPKAKRGHSFPSRHVFSAFLIAGLACMLSVWLSLALLIFAISMAIARVMLGIHFIRDVVAGALLGILSSALGILIFF